MKYYVSQKIKRIKEKHRMTGATRDLIDRIFYKTKAEKECKLI